MAFGALAKPVAPGVKGLWPSSSDGGSVGIGKVRALASVATELAGGSLRSTPATQVLKWATICCRAVSAYQTTTIRCFDAASWRASRLPIPSACKIKHAKKSYEDCIRVSGLLVDILYAARGLRNSVAGWRRLLVERPSFLIGR
jgi:hypothetical protein